MLSGIDRRFCMSKIFCSRGSRQSTSAGGRTFYAHWRCFMLAVRLTYRESHHLWQKGTDRGPHAPGEHVADMERHTANFQTKHIPLSLPSLAYCNSERAHS